MNSLNNLDNQFRRMLNNRTVVSVLSLLLALYAGAAAPKLPNEVVLFFDSALGKTLFMFLIVYLSSRSTQLSIMVAVAFLVTLSCMNKRNLEGFKDHEGGDEPAPDPDADPDTEQDDDDDDAEPDADDNADAEMTDDADADTDAGMKGKETQETEEENNSEANEEEEQEEEDQEEEEETFLGRRKKNRKEHFRYSFKKHKYTPAPVPVRENFKNYAPFPRSM